MFVFWAICMVLEFVGTACGLQSSIRIGVGLGEVRLTFLNIEELQYALLLDLRFHQSFLRGGPCVFPVAPGAFLFQKYLLGIMPTLHFNVIVFYIH